MNVYREVLQTPCGCLSGGLKAVVGQLSMVAAQQELLDGLSKMFTQYLSPFVVQHGSQAATTQCRKLLRNPDSVPVRELDECFLLWHTVDEWFTHFDSAVDEYDATENEKKLILKKYRF